MARQINISKEINIHNLLHDFSWLLFKEWAVSTNSSSQYQYINSGALFYHKFNNFSTIFLALSIAQKVINVEIAKLWVDLGN
jgi:hypothetical protein